jgi:hypothetical protein
MLGEGPALDAVEERDAAVAEIEQVVRRAFVGAGIVDIEPGDGLRVASLTSG